MSDFNAILNQLKINKDANDQTTMAVNAMAKNFGIFLNESKRTKNKDTMKGLEAAAESRGSASKSRGRNKFGVGGLISGAGSALKTGAKAGAFAGIAGIAGLAAAQFLDGDKIKKNVESILSIGDRYSEDTLKTFLSDGAVILALVGLGKGLITFGIGAAINAGVGYFADGTQWSEDVKSNVTNLLSIANDYTAGALGVLFEGAGVGLALKGLGVGLIAFGAGSALVAGSDAFAQWAGSEDWAVNMKNNVHTLLSIADGFGQNMELLITGAIFPIAMTGLAAGLGAFGIGSAFAIGSDAFAKFTGSEDWAVNVKNNVKTLLSIKDDLGGNWEMLKDGMAFTLAMTGLGVGLAAFGTGAVVAGGADMLSDWFSTGSDWAQHVKDNVITLLSIANLENLGWDTAVFATVMGGISAGLLAFATAGGATSVMDAIGDWLEPGEGRGNWTNEVKSNVANILSITEGKNADGKTKIQAAQDFIKAMGIISGGLLVFSTSQFIASLQGVGTKILSFFGGKESPMGSVMMISENADRLDKGAKALDSVGVSLEKLGKLNFAGGNFQFKEFAEDLAAATPVIEKAIMGGTFDDSWLPFNAQTIKGLADPTVDYKTAIGNISNLRAALALPDLSGPQPGAGSGTGGGTNTAVGQVGDNYSINNDTTPIFPELGGNAFDTNGMYFTGP